MDRGQTCELCEKRASTTCNVCGSSVCADHSREYGCDVCKGGVTQFE